MPYLRLALGGAVLAVVAVALALAPGAGDDGPAPAPAGDLAALAGAPCPPAYEVLRAGEFTDEQVEQARGGTFLINGEEVALEPRVDWTMNPVDARSFSHTLFKFQWIDPLLFAYRTEGDVEALEQATELALDFARANPPDGAPVDPDVWGDKRSGDRSPYLAYILRAAECEGLLDGEERDLLLGLMDRHVEVLTDPANYKPTNHGLFVDIGLTLLSRQLAFLPRAERWGELGRKRFERTLRGRTVADEGFWLEHSAGYQILLSRTVDRFLEIPGNGDPRLEVLRRKMHDVVGWLMMPDGRIPQLGDSDMKDVPEFGETRARDDRGILELDDSGLAVVKRHGGYLSVMASYHSDAHKHSDALTFDLYDSGRRLITDTGLYHKDKDRNFAFAHSSRAHSVLTVDGRDFPRDGSGTYGSGIVQTGQGLGYNAILGANPSTRRQGVRHERLFLYGPGQWLVIVDRVRGRESHRYSRYLHLAPDVEVAQAGAGLRLSAPGFRGTVTTNSIGGEEVELVRDREGPLQGLTAPSFRRWVPRWTARWDTRGDSLDHVTTIGLQEQPVRAELVAWTPELIRLDLHTRGEEPEGLKITEHGERFRISRVPVASK